MLGIADYGAFCAAILLFLALPGPGTFALLTSTAKGGFRAGGRRERRARACGRLSARPENPKPAKVEGPCGLRPSPFSGLAEKMRD